MGMDLLYSNQTLSSSLGQFRGSTKSENGFFPVPNIAWVHKTSNPALTFGLGLNAIAGFKTNLDLPTILSLGTAFTPTEKWLVSTKHVARKISFAKSRFEAFFLGFGGR